MSSRSRSKKPKANTRVGGAGGYNTPEVIELAKEVEALGADGILSVTPYYNKPTQEGLYLHYQAIASAIKVPIIVYSVAGRTGVNVEPATLKRLTEFKNIVAVKEASGSLAQMTRIRILHPGPHALSGDDILTSAVLGIGGKGIISVASNIVPKEMSRLAETNDFSDHGETREPDGHALHRIEPDPGQGRSCHDGPLRAGMAAAHVRAAACDRSKDPSGAGRPGTPECLMQRIEEVFDNKPAEYTEEHFRLFYDFKLALNSGAIRAAEPDSGPKTGWRVNGWVKKGILLRLPHWAPIVDMSIDSARQPWFDKATYPVKRFDVERRRSYRARRLQYPRRLLCRQRRHLHAARCTSMSAHMSATARWSTRTR